MVSLKPTTCGERESSTPFHLDEKSRVGRNKQEMRAHASFGNLECAKRDTDGVGIRFFHLWLSDLKPQAWSLCATAIGWAFSTKGHQNKIEKVPAINAQSPSKEAEQKSIETSCFGCPRVSPTAQMAIIKIILHRIISVV